MEGLRKENKEGGESTRGNERRTVKMTEMEIKKREKTR